MAKKSTKSSRRSRAKRESMAKQKSASAKTKATEAAIVAEGSDEPVVRTRVKQANEDKVIEPVVKLEPSVEEVEVAQMIAPARSRMLLSTVALGIVIVALIFVAAMIRSQHTATNGMVRSGQTSPEADKILQSGGSVCANGANPTAGQGSTNPDSVGMILQNVPGNNIQTPEVATTNSNDLTTLQGATCF